jgi:hypothetical protein
MQIVRQQEGKQASFITLPLCRFPCPTTPLPNNITINSSNRHDSRLTIIEKLCHFPSQWTPPRSLVGYLSSLIFKIIYLNIIKKIFFYSNSSKQFKNIKKINELFVSFLDPFSLLLKTSKGLIDFEFDRVIVKTQLYIPSKTSPQRSENLSSCLDE